MFSNNIMPDPPNPLFPYTIIETDPYSDETSGGRKHHGNIVVMSNQSQGNILAHGIGHAFQLEHVPNGNDPNNLMCTGPISGCTSPLGSHLSLSQWKLAVQGAQQWK